MNIELIVWEDSYTVDRWTEFTELSEIVREGVPIATVGLLVHESELSVALSNSWNECDAAATMVIPKAIIVHREILVPNAKLQATAGKFVTIPNRAVQPDKKPESRRRPSRIRKTPKERPKRVSHHRKTLYSTMPNKKWTPHQTCQQSQ